MADASSSSKLPRILVADDDEVTRKLLKEVLEKSATVVLAASGEEAVKFIRSQRFDVVLSDIRMVELDGMAVLKEARRSQSGTAVILMTGFGSMEGAIRAIQDGAFDYVSKPFQISELLSIVQRAVKHAHATYALRGVTGTPGQWEASRGLIGKSPRIVDVYKTLARAALSGSSVLIVGESGTGKELVARAIHENSSRREKKFVAVNCGALSEHLLESELFGHLKGAFTGAHLDKKGLFEEANGGTLFLDEIGDITPSLQIKLLRVLQESEVKPVGSADSRKVDVRLIAATHRDLEELVRAGKFREDLFYRLKVIAIELPPLRERMEDLDDLVAFFLAKFAEKSGKRVSHVSDEAMRQLRTYPWPGNVRELEHAIERAVAMTRTVLIEPEDLPPEIHREQGVAPLLSASTQGGPQASLEEMEKLHILRVLQDTQFNKSKASEILGIDRATLYRKAQKYRIDLRGK